jgi:site-specific DNA recombinase
VSETLFDRVQALLQSRDQSGEKQRIHNHYLKGSIFYARCGSRLCFTRAKGAYDYFYCLGRQQRRTTCRMPYLNASEVERAIERYYITIRLPEDLQAQIRDGLRSELDQQHQRAKPELAWAEQRVTELEQERRRLARGVVTGAIPGDLAREEQDRIKTELEQAQRALATAEAVYSHIEDTLNRALELLGRVDEVYRLGGPHVRRFANQCFFEKLLVVAEDDTPAVAGAVLNEPWATLQAEDFQTRMIHNATNPRPS